MVPEGDEEHGTNLKYNLIWGIWRITRALENSNCNGQAQCILLIYKLHQTQQTRHKQTKDSWVSYILDLKCQSDESKNLSGAAQELVGVENERQWQKHAVPVLINIKPNMQCHV